MSDLLLNERPLLLLPKLAHRVGLNEAIVLQQLHWTLLTRPSLVEDHDGRRWVRATVDYWTAEFPFWSESTIRRTLNTLKDAGLILTRRGRESNAYSIQYDVLDGQDDPSERSDRAVETGQDDRSLNREGQTTTETRETLSGDGAETLPGMEAPVKPPPDKPDDEAEKIGLVWAHWIDVFGSTMRVKELTPPRRRAFAKALKAVDGDVALMNRAIDGLKSYREQNPGAIQPSTIFETGPNSVSNLTDQIEWWAGHAKTTLLVADSTDRIPLDLSTVPSVTKGTIMARRREVMMMLAHPSERTIRERGEAAVDWLKEHTGHEPVIEDGEFKGWRYVE